MDFITHLPVTKHNHDAIFSIIDRFSKFCMFIPIKSDFLAFDCAQIFFNKWICMFGVPKKIISDRDTRFTSRFWRCLMK
jgi:hypothetical protein